MNGRDLREKKFLRQSFIIFLLLHILVIGVFPMLLPSPELEDEITIDIDLSETLPELNLPVPEPTSKKQMLPQLPKTFAIKNNEKLSAPDNTPLAETPSEDDLPPPAPKKYSNLIKAREALKRLALDRLRNQKQDEQRRDAAIKRKMQKALTNIANLRQSDSVRNKYRSMLRVAIKRNFVIHTHHEIKNEKIEVRLAITIDQQGKLAKLSVIKSSANRGFDDVATNAVKNSSPFPIPPKELVGEEIIIILTPLMTS